MKAKIKMGEREYEGFLDLNLYSGKLYWVYITMKGSECPIGDATSEGYFKSEAEALADAKAHGITLGGE